MKSQLLLALGIGLGHTVTFNISEYTGKSQQLKASLVEDKCYCEAVRTQVATQQEWCVCMCAKIYRTQPPVRCLLCRDSKKGTLKQDWGIITVGPHVHLLSRFIFTFLRSRVRESNKKYFIACEITWISSVHRAWISSVKCLWKCVLFSSISTCQRY